MATTLTSAQAADLIYRSMLTGVPTTEFTKAGGYDAVRAAAVAGGYDVGKPPAEKIRELGPQIAAQGSGNKSYAPGAAVDDMALLDQGYLNYYDQAAGKKSDPAAVQAQKADFTARLAAAEGGGSSSSNSSNSSSSSSNNSSSSSSSRSTQTSSPYLATKQSQAAMAASRPSIKEFMDATGSDFLTASNLIYGDVGANLDARNWSAIMSASDPAKAAKDGLAAMYSDPKYLVDNAANLITAGYTPEQADFTYKQMASRVGSTYDPNWAKGTQFEGLNTQAYLDQVKALGNDPKAYETFQNQQLNKWRSGDTAGSSNNNLVTGGSNLVTSGNSVVNQNTLSSGGGLAAGGGSAVTGGGLIWSADTFNNPLAMTPTRAPAGGTGLITGNMLTTPKAPTVKLAGETATAETAPTNTWKFGPDQTPGGSQIKSGIVTWTNPGTGQRVTYPAGTPSPGPGWVMG